MKDPLKAFPIKPPPIPAPITGQGSPYAPVADTFSFLPSINPGQIQAPQNGRFDGARNTLGNVVRLPGDIANAYSASFRASPQYYQDAAEERRIKLEALRRQQAEVEEMRRLIDQNITDPRERMTALANLQQWGARTAERYGVQNATGGNTIQYGDPTGSSGFTQVAPRMTTVNDTLITQTPTSATATGVVPERPTIPPGYRPTANGLEYIPGGPADPKVAGVKAAATRAPRVGGRGGSGVGGRIAGVPSGFVLD